MQHELNDFVENSGDKLVVVKFSAAWCQPCKDITPALDKIAEKYGSDIVTVLVICGN